MELILLKYFLKGVLIRKMEITIGELIPNLSEVIIVLKIRINGEYFPAKMESSFVNEIIY